MIISNERAFFKELEEKETERPWCLNCGEDKGAKFNRAFQRWYYQKINNWLEEHRILKGFKFDFFLRKKNNYDDVWNDLKWGKVVDDIDMEWLTFCEFSKYIEEYCLEFAEEQKSNIPNKDNIRERERERERERRKYRNSRRLLYGL